jgi:hypothetical protein
VVRKVRVEEAVEMTTLVTVTVGTEIVDEINLVLTTVLTRTDVIVALFVTCLVLVEIGRVVVLVYSWVRCKHEHALES